MSARIVAIGFVLTFLVGAPLTIAQAPAAGQLGDATAGRSVFFNRCVHCHEPLTLDNLTLDERARYEDSIPADNSEISWRGPALVGILGRKAGKMSGYQYSDAMTGSDVIWTESNLRSFLLKPAAFIPRNKMSFNGLKRPGELDDLIAYLAQ